MDKLWVYWAARCIVRRPIHHRNATSASATATATAAMYLLTATLSLTCLLASRSSSSTVEALELAVGLDADGSPLPQFQQHNNILHFSVHENKPPGSLLGYIRSSDGTPPYVVVPFAGTTEAERQAALTINLQTGELRTNAVLDREQRDHYTFVAIINSPFTEIKCTVSVLDVNDNAPFFIMPSPNDTYVIEIPEGQHSVRRALPLVFDLDSNKNGVQEFSIRSDDLNTPQSSFFLVDQSAPNRSSLAATASSTAGSNLSNDISPGTYGENQAIKQQLAKLSTILIPSQPTNVQPGSLPSFPGGGMSGQMFTGFSWAIDLETNITLDRENQSEYHLTVEAFDGSLTGRLLVTVRVTDVNDNDPIFTRDLYECRIKEDAPKGSPLIRVQAHDADSEANSRVSYFINRQLPVPPSQSNLISQQNSTTSDISASSSSKSARPVAAALASNAGSSTNGATVAGLSLTSKLQQAAQQRGQPGNSEMHEQTAGADLINAAASKQVKALNYGAQSEQILFEIEPTKGEISLIHPLDYETNQVYELSIEARDHGKPSRSGFAVVKVYVMDVNDDPPAPSLMAASARELTDKKLMAPMSEANRQEAASNGAGSGSSRGLGLEIAEATQHYFQNINLNTWFAQINSTMLFFVVIVALLIIAFPVCLVKIKSHQPGESDYNDSAGLTLIPNNGQVKQSPNHSTSDDHPSTENDNHHRQLPPTPCRSNPNAYRSWQVASKTIGYPIDYQSVVNDPMPASSTMDRPSIRQPTTNSHLLFGQLLEPCISSQHLFARELQGSYNWDYLADWVPDYHSIMYYVAQSGK